MRQIRIHIDQALPLHGELRLPEQAGEHVARVLRLAPGDPLVLFNGDGRDYAAELTSVGKRAVSVRVLDAGTPRATETPLQLTLAQGVARGDKMDWILQKATELGVSRIVPLLTERTEVRLDEERAERRVAHWRAVVASACEQSGRARLPQILASQKLPHWAATLDASAGLRLALLPEGELGVRELAPGLTAVTLAIGPEGGFSDTDRAALQQAGFRGLRLGPRILRTETAGLAALAALQAVVGDF